MEDEPTTAFGRINEIQFELSSEPRDPTPREAYAVFGEFVSQWREDHPQYEVTYLEVSRSSPQVLRMQFTHDTPLPPLAVIASWAIAAIIAAFAIAAALLVVTPAAKIAYEIVTGTGAASTALKYGVYLGVGLAGIWGASKVYSSVRGKRKK